MKDLGKGIKETGCAFPLVTDGEIDTDTLTRMGRTEEWLRSVCKSRGVPLEEVFLLTLDGAGEVRITRKEKKP